MSVSKISRGLIVAIFTALIILLIAMDIHLLFNALKLDNNIIIKIIYVIALLFLIITYALIKEKFNKKRIKKVISLTYRYIFLIMATFLIKIITIHIKVEELSAFSMLVYTTIPVISAIVLKKIIFNISKSDLLSVTGMFMYVLYPTNITEKMLYFNVEILNLCILFTLMYLQKLIDELKQLGLKTKKYLILSTITGILIGTTMFFKLNSLIWVGIAISLIFVTSSLDKTHINFSNKVINILRQKDKERLYSIERIYINKIFISILVMLIVSYVSYTSLNAITFKTNIIPGLTNKVNSIKGMESNNVINNIKQFKAVEIRKVPTNFMMLISNSKGYFLTLSIYILFIEILTVFLRRRYDTKSTIIKTLFILILTFAVIFKLNVNVYSHILAVLLTLISIINTSNLYLNRDERIKLLNS